MIKRIKKIFIILLLLLTVFPLYSCSKKEEKNNSSLRIGMVVGGIFDQYIPDIYPGASIEYFYAASDLPLALESGKIDLYIDDEFSAKEQCKQYAGQEISRTIHDDYYGFIFNKSNEELRDKINDFLKEISEDGRLSQIEDIWLNGDDESLKDINYDELTGENGTIKVGIAATMPHIDYVKDGKYVGYEPAILKEFCKEYGYNIEFQNSDFSSTMASVSSGNTDIGSASFSITEERKKSMLFSEPTMVAHCVAVVRSDKSSNITPVNENISSQKIGVVTGALFDVAVKNDDPNASVEYYNYTSDLPIALEGGKIDGYTVDEPVARILCNTYKDHTIVKNLTVEQYGIIISKEKPELQKQFNEFLVSLEDSGELYDMQDVWMGTDESKKVIDFDSLSNNKEILKLSTTSSMQPFDYIKDGQYAGYEIALVASFCKEYGYGLEIEDSNFTSVLAAVSSGKSDFGSCVITITDERKETMNFTIPIYEGGIVLVKKQDAKQADDVFDNLKGTNIGVQIGSSYDQYIYDNIENVNVEYFNLVSDMRSALDSNKISGFVVDGPVAELFVNSYYGEYEITGSLKGIDYGITLPKNTNRNEILYKQLDSFISKLNQDGTLKEIYNFWTSEDYLNRTIDFNDLTGENGEIELGVSSETGAPFVFKDNNAVLGYEVELIYLFCKEYGYQCNITDYNLKGLFAAIPTGKCDIGIAGISINDERKEVMLFVDEQLSSDCVVVVKNEDAVISTSDEGSLLDSFYKTFIREDRWKLFVSGIATTIIITALSIIIGTLLGFVLYMGYINAGVFLKKIIDIVRNIFLKTPTVVILMIFYYILFGKTDISGSVISIVGLSILFANSVMGLLVMGVNSIDRGQMEAAQALGFSKNKALVEIVFPQAILAVLSGYKSAIITLIKDSAIVGYIAVQDLTKISDIIRSRTYEAFFPLIATAIIYYLIATLFIRLVERIEFRIDPKKRKVIPILKGVKTNDKN